MFKAAGAISDEELMTGYRRFGVPAGGPPHPTCCPGSTWPPARSARACPIGVGVALNGKYLDKLPYHVWVLCGDSELAEGSIWEAFDKASYYKLDNLIAILDMNRLGQRGQTDLGWNLAAYAAGAEAFGCPCHRLDGHDLAAIDRGYGRPRPTSPAASRR